MNRKVIKKLKGAIFLLLLSVIASLLINSKGVFLSQSNKVPIYSVKTEEKKVAITFDVNWGQSNTKKILDILDKNNVKATFFLIGNWIDDFPEETKEIYKRGHEIGNHSNTHPDMRKVSKGKIINEISITDAKIMKIIGKNTKLFRCPSGSYNDSVIDVVNSTGHYCVQWDVDSIDWKAEGADKEYNRVISKTKPGSIILFHNDGKYTPQTLPIIIRELKHKGYQFVTVGDLIYKENYYINNEGKQIKKMGKQ
ncbi:polysaccharide deacetylase family sporulation protein PdaB [Clostridium tetanomorphum]|uniref:polysaccharide deacetylase family sporulation protein PdaB n=1 Tax=Clostridium tetanomorphum TaxID=1553 RepID=UPI00044F87CF|nr:polysaccharide deacetylase family sporulation protein PdaB [Clostridium tetanomorphum]KAJ50451.1 chitooligosaccharide deacetylase [Clostridium tetanomorphum DSM 665]MBP1865641.1 polysaccharide deacetylase family sporulation protein PdaB [Clostridium tetanomorphum]NRS85853.1 polysaccharide deacetylase family sporulation protein PdaB [Clostridium tetanomorphum]NRZ96139.1 polysaccharide deacetylase family sporulation protein PdaB [Clostridium tetanomorphum]SQB89949.1 chitooligosaccharide deace